MVAPLKPENRASPPKTHGSKFLNSLLIASLRWDQELGPAQGLAQMDVLGLCYDSGSGQTRRISSPVDARKFGVNVGSADGNARCKNSGAYEPIVLYAHASFLFPPLQKTTVFAG